MYILCICIFNAHAYIMELWLPLYSLISLLSSFFGAPVISKFPQIHLIEIWQIWSECFQLPALLAFMRDYRKVAVFAGGSEGLSHQTCCPLLSGATSPLSWALLLSLKPELHPQGWVHMTRVLTSGASRADIKLSLHAFLSHFLCVFPSPSPGTLHI